MSSGTVDDWDPCIPGTKVSADNSTVYIRPKKPLPPEPFYDEDIIKGIKDWPYTRPAKQWRRALIRDGVILHQCRTAMRGRALPDDSLGPSVRASIIRGVRCYYAFAVSHEVAERIAVGDWPELAQARNARLIMSNIIPDRKEMDDRSSQPYCIWYPDFASEATYLELARQCPSMLYQAGRACAAAGYQNAYDELCQNYGLLPDVSIAEEARESDASGGIAIFDRIMRASIKYRIMDDFDCSINSEKPSPGLLNGDTIVRWRLEERLEVSGPESNDIDGDIERDNRIGLKYTPLPRSRLDLSRKEVHMLYMPLPQDMPTVKKDILRKMAAYDGNIDRYARLACTPHWTIDLIEYLCIKRGIIHSTMFARWWLIVLDDNPPGYREPFARKYESSMEWKAYKLARTWRHIDSCTNYRVSSVDIRRAINARRIMINDVHHLTPDTPVCELPYEIWHPIKPHEFTLGYLATQCPQMMEQIAITCILSDYEQFYNQLTFTPHERHILAAKQSPQPLLP